jgi:hypothetical protein
MKMKFSMRATERGPHDFRRSHTLWEFSTLASDAKYRIL